MMARAEEVYKENVMFAHKTFSSFAGGATAPGNQ
jgi:hypothetical protein